MGDRLGIPGVVGFCFCLLDVANVIFLSLFPSKSIDALSMKQFAFYSTWSPKQNTFKMALKFSSFKCIHYITGCCRLLLLLIKCGKCHIFVLIPFIIYRRYINEAICLLFHLKSWKNTFTMALKFRHSNVCIKTIVCISSPSLRAGIHVIKGKRAHRHSPPPPHHTHHTTHSTQHTTHTHTHVYTRKTVHVVIYAARLATHMRARMATISRTLMILWMDKDVERALLWRQV